ncbi:MAG: SDR family NAD(P)-dependent oxidoreductase, partial [Burkholderiales bacterium]
MDLGIRGKRAIVTGASKGLGRACAHSLVAEGVSIAIVARGEAELVRVAEELRQSAQGDVVPIVADIATVDGRTRVLAAFPDPDILV